MRKKELNEMTLPPELRSKQGIEKWAERYLEKYREADRAIQEMVHSALERGTDGHAIGHLTKNELLEFGRWKSSGRRNDHHVMSNRETDVIERSHRAFVDENHEPLERLKGVALRTALAIMHFAFPRKYPIIDVRALCTLGIKASNISPKLWYAYQKNCRAWAKEYGVSLRTLDRALWQYDKDGRNIRDSNENGV